MGAKNLSTALGLSSVSELKPLIRDAIIKYQEGIKNSHPFSLTEAFHGFDVEKISNS